MKLNSVINYQEKQKLARIETNLTKNFVMRVYAELIKLSVEVIDLSGVQKVDTSALALLIEIRNRVNPDIKIINPPSRLLELAHLVEVDFLFHSTDLHPENNLQNNA